MNYKIYKNKYLELKFNLLGGSSNGSSDGQSSVNSSEESSLIEISERENAFSSRNSAEDAGYGNRKPIRPTEDTRVTFSNSKYDVLIIADGHGGFEVSNLSVQLAKDHFHTCIQSNNSVENALLNLFAFIHNQTKDKTDGATFNMAVIDRDTNILYCANLGDSVLVILRKNSNNVYEYIFETEDHEASNPKEQTRILGIDPHHIFKTSIDPPSTRIQTGLMPTRGFGDKLKDKPLGVIGRIPEIYTGQLLENDIIIQSSDGLYEFLYLSANKRQITGMKELRKQQILELINARYYEEGFLENLAEELLKDQLKKLYNYSPHITEDGYRLSLDNQSINVYYPRKLTSQPTTSI